MIRRALIAALFAAAAAFTPQLASASHFRGGAMVAQVSSSGMLTVTTTTFWRKTFVGVGEDRPTVLGVGGGLMTQVGLSITDQTDSRFAILTSVWQRQLSPGMQTVDIRSTSCCRVRPGTGGNWTENTWDLNTRIVWDGQNAANPIAFNFAGIQPEVNRNTFYTDNLNATSPDGLSLTYNNNLNLNIFAQPTATFSIDSTGQLFISAAETPSVLDNQFNVGADRAFSGNVIASNGSFVEFDWMFDGVDQAVNNAPEVSNTTVFGAPGTLFNYVFTITDPDGDTPLTFDSGFFSILGPAAALPATFNALTGAFSWDSTGSAPGTYIWQVRGSDPGGLTDVGSITIHLAAQQDPAVPEPASFLILVGMVGLVGGTSLARRRWMKS